jgi:hypothetical protein
MRYFYEREKKGEQTDKGERTKPTNAEAMNQTKKHKQHRIVPPRPKEEEEEERQQ